MANENASVGSGAMLEEAVAIFARNWQLFLAAGVAQAVIEVGRKIENREKFAGIAGLLLVLFIAMLASIAIDAIIARKVFVREGIADAEVPARYGAFIAVSIVVIFGIVLGSLLLIVPGIMLALAWALAANFTITRGMGIREALRASRDATRGHRGEIFGALVVFGLAVYGPYVLLVVVSGGLDTINSAPLLSALGAIRIAWAALAGMTGLAMGTGIFSVLVGRHGGLREVFA